MMPVPTPRTGGLAYPYNAPGACRLCGQPVAHPLRFWHKECLGKWKEMCGNVRTATIKRNRDAHEGKLVCERCNRECVEDWKSDDPMKAMVGYKIPIKLGGKRDEENRQILCCICHYSKLRLDRKAISKVNRKSKAIKAMEEKKFTPLSKFGFGFEQAPQPPEEKKEEPRENQPEQTSEKPDSESTSGEEQP